MPEHVTYLGAFVVSGLLWRGDLFREDEQYLAEHIMTRPNGTWWSHRHIVAADGEQGAISEALLAALEYLSREGFDPKFMSIIHYAPGMEQAALVGHAESVALH